MTQTAGARDPWPAHPMRVLLVSQYFFPEVGATQTRMMEFARALTDAGHQVDVLTEFPNHPAGVIPDSYRGKWIELDGSMPFRIIRVWVSTGRQKTLTTRLMFYGSFVAMALAAGLQLPRRYDVVAATSPPLPAAFAGWLLARLKRAAFVMDVRDLWPLAAGALKELSNRRMYRWAERLEQLLYDRADRITVTTRAFERHITAQDPRRAGKIVHVPNGTVEHVFDPARGDNGLRRRLGLQDRFVVTYAGLHGVAQDLTTVLEAAEQLKGHPRVHFLFVGEGPLKAALTLEARRRNLTSVTFHDQVPLEDSAWFLNASDALLVPLTADPVFHMFVPSKLFDAMACARPVLLSVDGEARGLLEAADAGLFVPPGDPGRLADSILKLANDPALCEMMGRRGRTYVLRNYLRSTQARHFASVVNDAFLSHAGRGAELVAGAGR
jgi:glycosyltransferase involved in cell wall biosynthesis